MKIVTLVTLVLATLFTVVRSDNEVTLDIHASEDTMYNYGFDEFLKSVTIMEEGKPVVNKSYPPNK